MNALDRAAYSSRFARIHPAEKAAVCLPMLLLSIICREPDAAFFVVIMASMFVFLGGVSLLLYIRLLLAPAVFILAGVLPIAFSFDGWLSVYANKESIQEAVTTACAAFAGAASLYAFILTTPFTQIIWLMNVCKLPSLFIEIVALVYRFTFQLWEKKNEVITAQMLRSGRPGIQMASRAAVHIFTSTLMEINERQHAVDLRGGLDYIPSSEWQSFWRGKK
jgi:cobalt/nickel transport system permease protein